MISAAERRFILTRAVVPEHLVDLMTLVSGGEAHLAGQWLCIAGREWLIVVGYPLDAAFEATAFDAAALESAVGDFLGRFHPREAWIVAPRIPPSLANRAVERESDVTYRLDLDAEVPRGRLARVVDKARPRFRIETASEMTPPHRDLTEEFLERAQPHPRVRRLALAMPEYVRACPHAVVLNAWTAKGRLAAFYVVDFSADRFATYVIGYASRRDDAAYASDLLMAEMARLSRHRGKGFIHLGLGVNAGIRRFKEKWGGVPAVPYASVKILGRKPSMLESLLGRS